MESNTVFNIISVISQQPYHAFLQFPLPIVHIIFYLGHWLLSNLTIIKIMVRCDRGTNRIFMTMINLQKDIGYARDKTGNPALTLYKHKNSD